MATSTTTWGGGAIAGLGATIGAVVGAAATAGLLSAPQYRPAASKVPGMTMLITGGSAILGALIGGVIYDANRPPCPVIPPAVQTPETPVQAPAPLT